MLLDDESIFDLLGARSDVEEQVEGDDPYNNIKTPNVDFGIVSSNEEHVALTSPANEHN